MSTTISSTMPFGKLHTDLWNALRSLPDDIDEALKVLDSALQEVPFFRTVLDKDEKATFGLCPGHKFSRMWYGYGWQALVFFIERPIKERLQGMPPFQFWIRTIELNPEMVEATC